MLHVKSKIPRTLRLTVGNDSGSAILLVLVVAVIGNILIGSVLIASRFSMRGSSLRKEKVSLINIAEAGKEHFYAKLLHEGYTPNKDTTEVVFNKTAFGDGYYTVRCSTGNSIDTMLLNVTGAEDGGESNIEVLVTKQRTVPLLDLSARLRGVIIARSNVEVNGSIVIDGRNYDSLGNPMTGSAQGGTSGVYTGGQVILDGAATIGGNNIAPVGKKDFDTEKVKVCDEFMSMGPNMDSPEAFLGVPAESLEDYKIKQSEVTLPFSGLIYFTESVKNLDLTNCNGILIVHDSLFSTHLHINKGNFKGLIICDIMDKSNGGVDVLGAVVSLGNTNDTKFGNGNASIRYSSQVLGNLEGYCANLRWKVEELAWREITPTATGQ